jgi:hypothetical protein
VNPSLILFSGLSITLLAALAVIRYLSGPLRTQLRELYGNSERAEFWTVFSNVAIVLTPAIFAMSDLPASGSDTPPLLALTRQLKWGLIGLVGTVLMLGWILSRFIPRRPPRELDASAQRVGGAM